MHRPHGTYEGRSGISPWGARLIQAEALDTKSAADLATSLADALEELHRLELRFDRRIRRDPGRPEAPQKALAAT
jgi:hypothetical protein